jgi:hypothetical protein
MLFQELEGLFAGVNGLVAKFFLNAEQAVELADGNPGGRPDL